MEAGTAIYKKLLFRLALKLHFAPGTTGCKAAQCIRLQCKRAVLSSVVRWTGERDRRGPRFTREQWEARWRSQGMFLLTAAHCSTIACL